MDDKQRKWIARLTGSDLKTPLSPNPSDDDLLERLAAIRARERDVEQKQKDVYIARVQEELDKEKKNIRAAFVFEVKALGKSMSSLGEGGDSTKTFDVEDIGKEFDKAVSLERLKLLAAAQDKLTALTRMLNEPTVRRTYVEKKQIVTREEPLFTKQEIADEVYTPLVREQLLPETFVPNEYSAVQKMLDESNEFYKQELESYREAEDEDRTEDVNKVLNALSGLIVAGEGLIPQENVQKAAEGITKLVTSITTTAVTAYGATKKQTMAGAKSVLDGVASIAGNIVGNATDNSELGQLLTTGIQSATSVASMVSHLSEPEPNIDGFLEDLIGGIGNAFSVASTITSDKQSADITVAGSVVDGVLTTLLTAKKDKLLQSIKEGKWEEVGKFIAQTTAKAVKIACQGLNTEASVGPTAELSKVSEELDKAETEEEKSELKKKKDELIEELSKLSEKSETVGETLDSSSTEFGEATELSSKAKEALEELKKKREEGDEKLALKEAEERLKREEEEFAAGLAGLGSVNPNENEVKAIASLIAKIESDRAIWKTILGLADVAAGVAAQVFEPMAAGGTLVEFIASAKLAVERMQHMLKWQASHGDAITAVSPYTTTIENFIKNQKEQFTQHAVDAALKVIKAASQFAQSCPVVTAAAKVVTAGVKVAETAQELIWKEFQERKVKQAWEVTRQALDNPGNRKLGLIARKLNPTLAKYSIAYGAVVRKDAIAMSAMNRIGLDRESLARRDASVSEVKKYLDTLYNEDVVVLGEYTPKDWSEGLPPKAALNVKCWLQTTAVAHKNHKLHHSPHTDIVAALKDIEKLEQQVTAQSKSPSGASDELYDTLIGAHERLVGAVKVYAPTATESDVPAKDMMQLANCFADLAEVRRAEIIGR